MDNNIKFNIIYNFKMIYYYYTYNIDHRLEYFLIN